jgi:hypothetical protein
MMAHDKYYGQALREAESGKRHDDLWGRAFAMAKGDSQVASGFYIGLLAKRLEEEAGAPERVAQALEAKLLVGTVGSMAVEGARWLVEFSFRWVLRAVICLSIAIGVTYGGTYVLNSITAIMLQGFTTICIGLCIFFGLFGGWLVLAWRRHFYVRKVQTVGPLPPVKV